LNKNAQNKRKDWCSKRELAGQKKGLPGYKRKGKKLQKKKKKKKKINNIIAVRKNT